LLRCADRRKQQLVCLAQGRCLRAAAGLSQSVRAVTCLSKLVVALVFAVG
jgi:hypothetical protein